MAEKLTRLTHKIAIQLHLVKESCIICSSRSRRPVRKLLDAPSNFSVLVKNVSENVSTWLAYRPINLLLGLSISFSSGSICEYPFRIPVFLHFVYMFCTIWLTFLCQLRVAYICSLQCAYSFIM